MRFTAATASTWTFSTPAGYVIRGDPAYPARPAAGLRLRRNGLIERIARSNTYRLTADGLTFALVYSRVHNQVLYPLTAHDQPIAAPAPIRPPGVPSPGISTAPSPPPTSGARPEPLPRRPLASTDSKLKTTVKVRAPQQT